MSDDECGCNPQNDPPILAAVSGNDPPTGAAQNRPPCVRGSECEHNSPYGCRDPKWNAGEVPPSSGGDFYEEDEDPADIFRKFDEGEKK